MHYSYLKLNWEKQASTFTVDYMALIPIEKGSCCIDANT